MWHISLLDIVDITLVAVVVYYILKLIRGTRAVQMLLGLAVVVLVYVLARIFGLLTVEWMFGHFFSAVIIILVVLFQHEIRRGLMRVGVNPLGTGTEATAGLVDDLVDSGFALVHRGWGGLIVIERDTGLKHLYEMGVEMKVALKPDVVQTLFCPQTPLHDGALIVRGCNIVAARVLLPLAQAGTVQINLGTRHRAAIGISEESDALIIVISEESGTVCLAEDGKLSNPLDHQELRFQLQTRLMPTLSRTEEKERS
ncbi:MAG: diadenylate cyclase CdaA [Mariprofundaceae bacterium]